MRTDEQEREDAIADQYEAVSFDPTAFTRFESGTDYAAFAESLGCHGTHVSDPQRIHAAVKRALEAVENDTHAILDVRVSMIHGRCRDRRL